MKALIGIFLLIINIYALNISKPFVQIGHTKLGIKAAISKNGRYVLSSDSYKFLKLWDTRSGRVLHTLKGHKLGIKAIAISEDSNYGISGSRDQTIRYWNLKTGKTLKVLKGHTSAITTVAISRDGNYAISGSEDKTIRYWDLKTGKILKILKGHKANITTVAISTDGNYVVSCGYEEGIYYWNLKLGKLIKVMQGNSIVVKSLVFSPDGKYILSGGMDGDFKEKSSVKYWDLKTGKAIKTLNGHLGIISVVDISHDGKYALSAGRDKTIRYWNLETDKLIKVLNTDSWIHSASIEHGGLHAIYINKEKIIYLDLYSGKKIKSFGGSVKYVKSIDISSDEKYILVGSNYNLLYWDLSQEKTPKFLKGHTREISSVDIGYGGLNGVSFGKDSLLKYWDLKTGKTLKALQKDVGEYGNIVLSNNNKFALFCGYEKTLKSWNVHTGEITDFKKKCSEIDISKDDNYALISNGFNLYYLDLNTGKIIIKFENSKGIVLDLKLSNNKSYAISTYMDGMIKYWNVKTGKCLKTFHSDGRSRTVDISLDGKHAIYVSKDNIIRYLDLNTGKIIRFFEGHIMPIFSVKISLSKKYIVSGSADGTTKVWNLKTGKELLSMTSFEDESWLIITPEGYFNGSAGAVKHLNITKYTKDGMEPFDFSQLYDHFFRPDLVKLKLSGDEEAYQKAINGMTYQEALKNPPPKLAFETIGDKKVEVSGFEYEESNSTADKTKLTFGIKEHDGGGIGLIRIYQEGKLIQTIGEGQINKQSANVNAILDQEKLDAKQKKAQTIKIASLEKELQSKLTKSIDTNLSTEETIAPARVVTTTNKEGTYSIDLDLIAGANEISIEAFNKTNTVTSYRENITINANIPKKEAKLYAIVAGVNNFESDEKRDKKKLQLKYSQKDAQDIKKAIESQTGKLYSEIEVIYLEGNEVTKDNILKASQEISKKAKLEDTVLFYISTHGRAIKGKLYLVPYNNKSAKNWIDFEQTFQAIQSIKALNQIFILDTCESGKANDIVSSVYDSRASVLARSSGVHMLLATTKGTFAFESTDPKVKNGVFTHKILQALKDSKVDSDKDGTISILELSKKLKEPSNNAEYQYPVIRNVGSDVGVRKVGE